MLKRVLILLLLVACGKDSSPGEPDSDTDVTIPEDTDVPDADEGPVWPQEAPACDELNEGHCVLPWPSSYFLEPDAEQVTGYTLSFGPAALPTNKDGVSIDPEPYRRRDGFSLGTPAVALFPRVDASGFPDEYSIELSMAQDAQIMLLEVGEEIVRVPYFVDHDGQTTDLARKSVIVRPAVILKPGTRYVVAFRNLKDLDGAPIARSAAFEALVGRTADGYLEGRQARFDEIFSALESQGWQREELTLAWDWVTASQESLHGDLLYMRDDALARFPDGPEIVITSVQDMGDSDARYRIEGHIEVPHYIDVREHDAVIRRDAEGNPVAEGTREVAFWVTVPRSAIDGTPHGLLMYGHGLFGLGSQTYGGFNTKIANDHGFVVFGASLWGMSNTQSLQAPRVVTDLSRFRLLGDQLHQGIVEWVLLARAFKSRFGQLQEVRDLGVVLNEELFYSGISQGGIFGPTFVALSPDVRFGHAGVPGHTYSTLLHRSVDFAPFFAFLKAAYPDPVDQLLALNTIQILWDGTDPASHIRRLSADPFDGVVKHMLWVPAKGDFQVSVMQNEVMARTGDLGVALMANYDVEREPAFIDQAAYPHRGSAVVLYDFGVDSNGNEIRNAWPRPGNVVPTAGPANACAAECPRGSSTQVEFACCEGQCCFDPHALPRRLDEHNAQMVHFFRSGGEVIDVCGGSACRF